MEATLSLSPSVPHGLQVDDRECVAATVLGAVGSGTSGNLRVSLQDAHPRAGSGEPRQRPAQAARFPARDSEDRTCAHASRALPVHTVDVAGGSVKGGESPLKMRRRAAEGIARARARAVLGECLGACMPAACAFSEPHAQGSRV